MCFDLKVLICCLLIPYLIQAQETDKYSAQFSDSSYRFQGIIPPVEFQYNFYEIFRSPIINTIPEDVLFDDNRLTVWLRTELMISSINNQNINGEMNLHLTSPLYQQYLKDSDFDMVRYVLGTIQTGVVAYMAYRHIKKYGFWK